MTATLTREAVASHFQHALSHPSAEPHPGLLLHKGLGQTAEDNNKTAKSQLIGQVCQIKASGLYQRAYDRWQTATCSQAMSQRFASVTAGIEGRLYIGTERSNALETGITTHRSYGMPLIPGSAVKGNCRSHALAIGLAAKYAQWIFGNEWGGDSQKASPPRAEDSNADTGGALIFHDAWWEPGSGPAGKTQQPFAPEIITPHHSAYHSSGGKTPATDFDSPIPAPQIATHGRFYFVIESREPAASPATASYLALARELLIETLQHQGLGGKGSSGYGYFSPPAAQTAQ